MVMSIAEVKNKAEMKRFIASLYQRGILISLVDGKLKTKAKPGAFTPDLIAEVKQNKDALITYLLEQEKESIPKIGRVEDRNSVYPLSFAQHRLWFIDQLYPQSPLYNIPVVFEITGKFNPDVAQEAIQAVVDRHEIIRTVYVSLEDGSAGQRLSENLNFELNRVNFSELTIDEQEVRVAQFIKEDANTGFDLSQDLMLRASWLQIAENKGVMVFNTHHIASDGWSMEVLLSDFSKYYQGIIKGQRHQIEQLAVQYLDYAVWQREWLQGEMLESQLGYWLKQLADLPSRHSLPQITQPTEQKAKSYASVSSLIDVTLVQKLQKLCRVADASLFMGIHAAFAAFLARYSNETDIVIGSPIANREQAELASLIGFFVNTLVLRSDLSAVDNFTEMLQQSKRILTESYAHQHVPFELLVEKLQPERNEGQTPLFQVMLVFQSSTSPKSGTTIGDLKINEFSPEPESTKFDLTLNVIEYQDGLRLEWEYNRYVFRQETIHDMAEHFTFLLQGMLSEPKSRLFTLPLMPPTQLLLPPITLIQKDIYQRSITEHFEERVEHAPNAIALVSGDKVVRYRDLNTRSNQLAHYLVQQHKVVSDSRVGVCMHRSEQMVIAILAILKSGATFVCIDPLYPPARQEYLQQDAQLNTILTLNGQFSGTNSEVESVYLDDMVIKDAVASHSEANLILPKQPDTSERVACVFYTSGTTGQPKGVMVTHLGIVSLGMECNYVEFSPATIMLLNAAVAFDALTIELWGPLLNGGQLIIQPEPHIDTVGLEQLMRQYRVNTMFMATALFDTFVSLCYQPLPDLKYLMFGGEQAKIDKIRAAKALNPELVLVNLYGPTENTTVSSYYVFPQAVEDIECIAIGKGISNRQLHVLDEGFNPVPPGVVAELFVGGVGLALGYLHRPELTEQNFVSNPFYEPDNEASSKVLYRTGDLVQWLPDGNLVFVGRKDKQVKIRGYRIELGEIAHAINQLPFVQDAVVLAHKRQQNVEDKYLVGYAVMKDEQQLSSDWRQQLQQQLPDFMVPVQILQLDTMPLTANGKLDTKALPVVDSNIHTSSPEYEYVAPASDLEQSLANVWKSFLGWKKLVCPTISSHWVVIHCWPPECWRR